MKQLLNSSKDLINRALSIVGIRLMFCSTYEQLQSNNSPAPPSELFRLDWPTDLDRDLAVPLALRDLVRPGNTVFDCGSWVGVISVLASRLVGPRGRVCAFEANPNVMRILTKNLGLNGCFNTFVVARCLWRRSGEIMEFGVPANPAESNGSLYQVDGEKIRVESLALDDFIQQAQLEPDVIKFDIEEAEYDALGGMEHYLDSHRPHLILEQSPESFRCVEFLTSKGYLVYDLSSFVRVRAVTDFLPNAHMRNVVAIHESRLAETPYPVEFEFGPWKIASAAELDVHVLADAVRIATRETLPCGRYAGLLQFSGPNDEPLIMRIFAGTEKKAQFYGTLKWLFDNLRDFVVDVNTNSVLAIEFVHDNVPGPPDLAIESLRFRRLENFTPQPAPVYL